MFLGGVFEVFLALAITLWDIWVFVKSLPLTRHRMKVTSAFARSSGNLPEFVFLNVLAATVSSEHKRVTLVKLRNWFTQGLSSHSGIAASLHCFSLMLLLSNDIFPTLLHSEF